MILRFLHVFAKNAVNWTPRLRLTEQNPGDSVFCTISLPPCFSICVHLAPLGTRDIDVFDIDDIDVFAHNIKI